MARADRAQELALQRQRLRARSAALRAAIAHDVQVLAPPLALADHVRDGWRWLRRHPEWPLGGLVLVVLLRPRRVLRVAVKAWGVWQLWRRARRLLAAALPRA